MRAKTLEYSIVRLKNGLEVLLLKRPEKYTVGSSLLIRSGSIHETDKTSGVSHFFEHLMFRGSKNLPTEQDIREAEINLGIDINANTDYDAVYVNAVFPRSELESCLKHIKEIAFESKLENQAIQREKEIMLSEEGLRRDNIGIELWDLALRTRFINGNPLRLPREGTPNVIKNISPRDIKEAYKIHAKAANALLAIGANYDFKKLKKIIERIFGNVEAGRRLSDPDTTKVSGYKVVCQTKELKQVYLALNFPYFPKKSLIERWKNSFTVNLLSENLYRRLILEKGLVHTSGTTWEKLTTTTAIIYINAVCSPHNFVDIVSTIFTEIKKAKKYGYDPKLFERWRRISNKNLAMNYDSLSGSMSWALSSYHEQGKIYSPEEVIEARNRVKISDLQKSANEIFDFKKLNFVCIGPLDKIKVKELIDENK